MTDLVLSAPADHEPPVGPDAPLLDVMATMRAMRRLNASYRQQDRATNVLSFPTLELDPEQAPSAPPRAQPRCRTRAASQSPCLSSAASALRRPCW